MAKLSFVFFDLDGTLRDTRDLMYNSLQDALEQYTGKRPTPEEINPHIHHHRAVHQALAAEVPVEDFEKTFLDLFEQGRATIQLYEGAVALLEDLRARGLRLAVVTSARTTKSRDFLTKHNLHAHFETVSGMEEGLSPKPAPDLVLRALAAVGCAPDEAIMVGDTTADITAAHAAGVRCIGITHGFGTAEELRTAGAEGIIDKLVELPAVLDTL